MTNAIEQQEPMPASEKEPRSLRSQVVPYEERASQNVKFSSYLKHTFSVLAYTALGTVIGGIIGKSLESKDIGSGSFQRYGEMFGRNGGVDMQSGASAGAKVGLVVGIYKAWKNSERKRLSVKEISSDLMPAMEPEHLAQEVKQEQAILDDLQVVQDKLERLGPSHVQREETRRATGSRQELQP